MGRAGYDVAKPGRLTAKLHNLAGLRRSGEVLLLADEARLQAIGRYLFRNNPQAKRAAKFLIHMVVGRLGPWPQFEDDDIDAAWRRTARAIGVKGQRGLSWRKVVQVAGLDKMTAGGGLLVRSIVDGRFRLQMIEPEQLARVADTRASVGPGEQIVGGIRYNAIGEPIGYLISKGDPGLPWLESDWEEIPADRVYHYYDIERPLQWRGAPDFAAGALSLFDATDAKTAELTRKRMESYAGMHFKPAMDSPGGAFDVSADDGQVQVETLDSETGQTVFEHKMEPGQAIEYNGEVSLLTSNTPSPEFQALLLSFYHDWAVNMGIPPHVVTGDFSKVNYSSAKMSENMSVPTYEEVQDDMIDMLCRPIVEDWLEWAVMIGEVKLKNRTAESILAGLEWQMPARPLIDPVKDRQALEMALRTGEMTWDQMVASRGKDPREQRKAILRQRELDEEFNLQTPGIAWEPAKLPATGDEIAAGIAAVNGGGA